MSEKYLWLIGGILIGSFVVPMVLGMVSKKA